MKEMGERIEAMDQITHNMDREFKSSRVVSFVTHCRNCKGTGHQLSALGFLGLFGYFQDSAGW